MAEVKLFDIVDGVVTPTEHCYTINSLRNILDEYGDNSGKVFACIHYLHSLNPESSPYAFEPQEGKWERIINEVCPELDLNNPAVDNAREQTKSLYENSLYKIYKAFKDLLDKLAKAVGDVKPDLTKNDGNMLQIKQAVHSYKELKAAYIESFQEFTKDLDQSRNFGGRQAAYDDGHDKLAKEDEEEDDLFDDD